MTSWAEGGEAGERRQLTVMFCDLVGSTRLSQAHDPEVVRSVVRGYRQVLDEVVTEVDGTIALWVGDGALVYFGYPVPHEDDAWRGVHAGVELLDRLDAVAAAAAAQHGIDVAVRIAVHTGLVVRADMGTPNAPDSDAVVGSTPNLAARLQDVARPGTLLISAATHALVSRRFDVVPVGPFDLRGIDGAVDAYEVVTELPATPAVESWDGTTIFINRHDELASLLSTWESVEAGAATAVLIAGDPGIGKTRLSAELRRRVVDRGGRALLGSCSEFHRSSPLFPMRRVIETAAAAPAGSSALATLELVRPSLEALHHPDAVGIVADLLGVASDARPAVDLEPPRRHEVTLVMLVDWLAATAAEAPLLLLLDDVQWADPTTVALIDRIVARRPPNLMLVMTGRPGHPWPSSKVGVIELGPLAEPEVRSLITGLAGALAEDVVSSLVQRADGVPLYVEELVRDATTSGTTGVDLPASLRDPLLSRLAAAGDDVGLAQMVATIGDDVDTAFLAAVTGHDKRDLNKRLEALVAVGLLDTDAHSGAYRFHHRLMADLTYETQLRSALEARHLAVADAIERGAGRRSTLGRHLELAGRPGAAIRAHVDAARAAQRVGAHTEALSVLDHAVDLLPSIVDAADRSTQELLVLECRGFSWTSTLGLASPEAAADFGRCLELIRTMPGDPVDARVLTSAYNYFSTHGQLAIAEELVNRQGRDAERSGHSAAEAVGAGFLSFVRGDFLACIAHSRAFLATEEGRIDRPVPPDYPVPNEPVASTLGTLAAALAFTGDVDGAVSTTELLRQRVAELPFPHGPHSAASGLSMACLGWWNLRDETRFRHGVREIREIADRHGMMAYEVLSNLQDALAACRFGGPGAGAQGAMMVDLWKATGVLVFVPAFGAAVAEGLLRDGDADGARQATDEHLALSAEMGATFSDSMLLRVRGAARLAVGDEGGIDDLRRAAATAARQGAALAELQAHLELVHHRDDPVVRAELRRLVESPPVEQSFADLDTARELLARS